MDKSRMTIKYFFVLIICLYSAKVSAQVSLYKAPKDFDYAIDFEVLINGQKSFVYHNRVAAFTSFSFSGEVEVAVVFPGRIHEVDIRPKSMNIRHSVKGDTLLFTLGHPANLSIEINRNIRRPLFLFANGPDPSPPSGPAGDVYFFEAGKVHEPGRIKLKDDDIVYIEGGAVVKGSFDLEDCKRVHIYGSGILTAEGLYTKGESRMIGIARSEDITIEGIIINDSRHWTMPCSNSQNIVYRNVKLISGNDWDDGIDIVSSRNVLVDGCFIRTKDDCIAIKGGISFLDKQYRQTIASDIKVTNCVLWNAEWGNALEIGFETRCDTIRNIVFSNCDLIHVEGNEGTFSIHNGDRALVHNVLYENIRVEDAEGILVDFKILESRYSRDKERGRIQDIVFRNIDIDHFTGPGSILRGYDRDHLIRDISLTNFKVNGRLITNADDLKLSLQFVKGLKFTDAE